MPAILAGANPRMNLSSAGHTHSDVNLDDPNFEKMNITHGNHTVVARVQIFTSPGNSSRYGDRIQSFAVHPGVIMTELGRHLTPELMNEMTERVKSRATSSRGERDWCSSI